MKTLQQGNHGYVRRSGRSHLGVEPSARAFMRHMNPEWRRIEVVDQNMAEILRRKTPAQRIAIGFGLWRSARRMLRSQTIAPILLSLPSSTLRSLQDFTNGSQNPS